MVSLSISAGLNRNLVMITLEDFIEKEDKSIGNF